MIFDEGRFARAGLCCRAKFSGNRVRHAISFGPPASNPGCGEISPTARRGTLSVDERPPPAHTATDCVQGIGLARGSVNCQTGGAGETCTLRVPSLCQNDNRTQSMSNPGSLPDPLSTPAPSTDTSESFGEALSQFDRSHAGSGGDGSKQLEGTVIAVTADSVIVDIGFKSEGILPLAPFQAAQRRSSPATGFKFVGQRKVQRLLRIVSPEVGVPTHRPRCRRPSMNSWPSWER